MGFADENIAAIRSRLDRQYGTPLLGIVPHLKPISADAAADAINTSMLLQTLRAARL
jgi:dethiobiotin synthetase